MAAVVTPLAGNDSLNVAVVQWSPSADPQENLERMGAFARAARHAGAEVTVFPEYSAYFENPPGPGLLAAAEDLDGPFVAGLSSLASETGMHIVAGMVERSVNGKVHNTLVAVGPDGQLVAVYRKMHLYDAFGARESDWMESGGAQEPAVFDRAGLCFGLQTCYDVRFPEVSRRLIDAGADVLVVPAEWVRGSVKEHHWRTLLAARAIENTAYVVAADHTPPIGIGRSMIVDPLGLVQVELGEEEGVAVAALRSGTLASVREVNPALQLRRFAVVPQVDPGNDRTGRHA